MTTPGLPADLRKLLDLRLDDIERMLLQASVSYSERHHILDEVEAHVFELLARTDGAATRDRLQSVLDSLDPAEAYVPEELRGKQVEFVLPTDLPSNTPAPIAEIRSRPSQLAILSGLFAATSLIGYSIAQYQQLPSENFYERCLLAASLMGLVSLVRVQLSEGRLHGFRFALFAVLLMPVAWGELGLKIFLKTPTGVVPWITLLSVSIAVYWAIVRGLFDWFRPRKVHFVELLGNLRRLLTGGRLAERTSYRIQ